MSPTVRRSRRRRALAAAALILAAPVVGLLGVAAPASAVEVGSPAPDYGARTLDDDTEIRIAELDGEVRLLNLWATWCDPCVEEMPFLEELHADHAEDGLAVVGVNIDSGGDAAVVDFVDGLGVTFPQWRDPDNDFQRAFRTRGVPETVLLDADGELLHRWRGPLDVDPDATREIVAAALDGRQIDTAGMASVGLAVAFAAGILSFLSPCVLPLVPTYLAVITGRSVGTLADGGGGARAATVANAAVFVAGFSIVFVALGASASAIGQVLDDFTTWIARVGGVVVAIFGLHLLGVFRIPLLYREARAFNSGMRAGRAGTFLIGMGFAAGWTPCIGPVLAAILTLSATSASVWGGLGLLGSYSVGMAIPFLLAALLLGQFFRASQRIRRHLPVLERASGVLCLIIAVLLVSGALERLNQWFGGMASFG